MMDIRKEQIDNYFRKLSRKQREKVIRQMVYELEINEYIGYDDDIGGLYWRHTGDLLGYEDE